MIIIVTKKDNVLNVTRFRRDLQDYVKSACIPWNVHCRPYVLADSCCIFAVHLYVNVDGHTLELFIARIKFNQVVSKLTVDAPLISRSFVRHGQPCLFVCVCARVCVSINIQRAIRMSAV